MIVTVVVTLVTVLAVNGGARQFGFFARLLPVGMILKFG